MDTGGWALGRPYFGLGLGAFLALYLPQPLLPELDRDLGTSPAVIGLVMTAALLGFATAGILPEGEPARTLRRATWLTVAASLIAAVSPNLWLLLPARAAQCAGIGLLVATVGRYLTAYYVGGAAAAPLMAASYLRWGWSGVILPLSAATLIVAGLALARGQPYRAHVQM